MEAEQLLLFLRLSRRTLRRFWRRLKRPFWRVVKWALWGLALSFVAWLIIAGSGYGPVVGFYAGSFFRFLESIAATVRGIGGF